MDFCQLFTSGCRTGRRVQQKLNSLYSSAFTGVDIMELNTFLAVMRMLKVDLGQSHPKIYKMLLAVLRDYDPALGKDHIEKTKQYITLLLEDHILLADFLISILPPIPSEGVSHSLHLHSKRNVNPGIEYCASLEDHRAYYIQSHSATSQPTNDGFAATNDDAKMDITNHTALSKVYTDVFVKEKSTQEDGSMEPVEIEVSGARKFPYAEEMLIETDNDLQDNKECSNEIDDETASDTKMPSPHLLRLRRFVNEHCAPADWTAENSQTVDTSQTPPTTQQFETTNYLYRIQRYPSPPDYSNPWGLVKPKDRKKKSK